MGSTLTVRVLRQACGFWVCNGDFFLLGVLLIANHTGARVGNWMNLSWLCCSLRNICGALNCFNAISVSGYFSTGHLFDSHAVAHEEQDCVITVCLSFLWANRLREEVSHVCFPHQRLNAGADEHFVHFSDAGGD